MTWLSAVWALLSASQRRDAVFVLRSENAVAFGWRCDIAHSSPLGWAAIGTYMLRELAHLLEIQKEIRAKARVLAVVAENEAGSAVADRCERLSLQCKQLDSAIEAFVSGALAGQASQGTA